MRTGTAFAKKIYKGASFSSFVLSGTELILRFLHSSGLMKKLSSPLHSFCLLLFAAMISCSQMELPEDVTAQMASLPEEIDFNRDVKKILSDKCFSCHGPDAKKQKAELRLDLASFAYEKTTESGLKAIRPGSLTNSEIIHRILSSDPEYKMPTPESHLELTAYEKAVLVKWVEQGAEYKPHWAFVAPEKPKVPSPENKTWVKNDIDKFILKEQEKNNLRPAPEADRKTLIRRLSFDIRGVSPTEKEITAFEHDQDPKAYEKLIDQFLSSKHYGERMAAYWLDVSRFADSHGYLDDKHRDMTPWRDWVISAYNRNIPFDKFITWQMAGDLLPNPTQEQILATGFNRNHKQNSEAGVIDEEFRVEYVTDRTNTLGTALMAMTLGCAKCHDHKYDPISQKDYYSLFAFFNSTFEKGSPNYGDDKVVPGPTLMLTSPDDEKKISQLQARLKALEKMESNNFTSEEKRLQSEGDPAVAVALASKIRAKLDFEKSIPKDTVRGSFINLADKTSSPSYYKPEFGKGVEGRSVKYNVETRLVFPATKIGYYERHDPFSVSLWLKIPEKYPLATIFYSSENHRYGYQGYDLLLKNNRLNFRLSHSYPHDAVSVISKKEVSLNQWSHVAVSYDGSSRASGVSIFLNGQKLDVDVEYDNLKKNIQQHYSIHKGPLSGFTFGEKALDKSMPNGEIDDFHLFSGRLTSAEVNYLFNRKSFPLNKQKPSDTSSQTYVTRKNLSAILDSAREVMVMGDLPVARPTFVLQRGVYDSYGEKVIPATPSSIFTFSPSLPQNRLGLSKWLFDDRNPLTARVAVNRIWQLIFGKGIVATSDDFGNQGAMPTHPELLDHLAIWYRENGWDTKALMKYIFMSAAYRQSSVNEKNIMKADPDNKWLTRNPRYRLPAEMLRDNALHIAGLLSEKIGGPSVYPYQPAGLWEELSDKVWRYKYIQSEGEDLYRKSIYTIRKRTSVVPFLQIFDAPDRSVCTVKRQVSSSPMQSLAMLNDPQIVEAAKLVGKRMMSEGGKDQRSQLIYAYRLITGRDPGNKELNAMHQLCDAEIDEFQKNPGKAKDLLAVGMQKPETSDEVRLAAYTHLALSLMNTDEFLTRK